MTTNMNPTLGSATASATVPKGYQAQPGSHQAPANYQRVAVIVHHGMGQQVPYETVEGVAKSIWSQAGTPPLPPVVRNVRLGVAGQDEIEPELVRAELRLAKTIDGNSEHFDVHVYESYWAPLTEGQVSISDVIWFLLRAGWNGFWNTTDRTFRRWLFGGERLFKLPTLRLMLILIGLLAFMLSLVFINSVLAAAAAAHAIGSSSPFPSGGLLAALTADILLIDAAAVLIILGVFVFGRFAHWLAWLLIYGGAGLIVFAAVLMVLHLGGNSWPWQQLVIWDNWVHAHPFWVFWIWAAEVVAAYGMRWTLIEYVGDVTAYIAAYSVSKFWKLRQDIRDTAMKVMRAVYRARTPDGKAWLYDKIIVVGHSLGSVIGYDTLNSLLLEAARSNSPLLVPERTRMFLTFGSPLDKTAFLFRTLKDMHSEIREVGAAAVQPMIADYAYRPAEWVNLWSQEDIVSGELDYYDPPTARNARYAGAVVAVPPNPKRVNNSRDLEATTPLKAHVEYWNNRLLATELWRAVTT
jgi:hypothetical protein